MQQPFRSAGIVLAVEELSILVLGFDIAIHKLDEQFLLEGGPNVELALSGLDTVTGQGLADLPQRTAIALAIKFCSTAPNICSFSNLSIAALVYGAIWLYIL